METKTDQNANAPAVVNGSTGRSAVADYQSAVTATTYRVSNEANVPQYVIPSSLEK